MQDPRGEQAVRLLRTERRARPVAAGRERVAREVEQAAPPEPAEHPLPEPEPGRRPQLRPENTEADVRIGHELLELALPRRAVAVGPAVELDDVRLERGLEEHRGTVREGGGRGEVGVDVLEAAGVEVIGELRIGRGALEEWMPGAQHLVREAGRRVVGLRPDRAAEPVRALEDAYLPSVLGEERRGGQRVDPRAHQNRVVGRHAATLPRFPLVDMSPVAV